ncbi:MAG TPA: creatininase family protein [Rectinema sp.]|nr:creatininase family protein [Spirochaetia bacterium]HOU60911.1 creatininase family protein [Rectinema sp.]
MFAQNLTFPHFEEQIKKIDTIVIPTGSLEAHGRHCPLGTDILIPERLCKDLELAMGDRILIAPSINYGYSPLLRAFPGTIHLSAELLISIYSEVAKGFIRWGAKNIVFMNGHGGNIPMLSVACDRIAEAGGSAMVISWWATFSQEILGICSSQGHAGEDETSVMMAIDATLVDQKSRSSHVKKAFSLPLATPDQVAERYPDAMNGNSLLATKEKGERLLAMMLEKNIEYIDRLRRKDLLVPIEIS